MNCLMYDPDDSICRQCPVVRSDNGHSSSTEQCPYCNGDGIVVSFSAKSGKQAGLRVVSICPLHDDIYQKKLEGELDYLDRDTRNHYYAVKKSQKRWHAYLDSVFDKDIAESQQLAYCKIKTMLTFLNEITNE